ncbi:Na+/H+ antiporter subunit E [Bosea sp. (in: a-proteobacteria)]|uniref:Na+/H+ antiporter subunit E n=1 Tax=Bosea sp. (in: a-proteobacteria) TaxID=1871050 RepID=UPI0026111BCB|nr:Na+/H+ antiporter subunit E [Bosea sp. (in: a-proteobacteria)]MCO5091055.1 Na+/H+ antiporter subunit E [Bosea sp. (in: a-proteobacteria)]
MDGAAAADDVRLPALAIRGLCLLGLWVILIGPAPADLPVGLAASAAGVWASARLWPAGGRLSPLGLLRFLLRFLPQSVVAGLDVARRAFAREPNLRPGFARCRSAIPAGLARDTACAVMSLQPGKLPVAVDEDGTLLIHCLDLGEPVAEQVAADEAAFRQILAAEARDG